MKIFKTNFYSYLYNSIELCIVENVQTRDHQFENNDVIEPCSVSPENASRPNSLGTQHIILSMSSFNQLKSFLGRARRYYFTHAVLLCERCKTRDKPQWPETPARPSDKMQNRERGHNLQSLHNLLTAGDDCSLARSFVRRESLAVCGRALACLALSPCLPSAFWWGSLRAR